MEYVYKGIKISPQPMPTYNESGEKKFSVRGMIDGLEDREYVFNFPIGYCETEAEAYEAFRKFAEKYIDDDL